MPAGRLRLIRLRMIMCRMGGCISFARGVVRLNRNGLTAVIRRKISCLSLLVRQI